MVISDSAVYPTGQNLVSKPQSEREEADQKENGPVRWERRLGPQRPRLRQPAGSARLAESVGYPRFPVSPAGHERFATNWEYTASHCGPVNSCWELCNFNWALHHAARTTRRDPLTWIYKLFQEQSPFKPVLWITIQRYQMKNAGGSSKKIHLIGYF